MSSGYPYCKEIVPGIDLINKVKEMVLKYGMDKYDILKSITSNIGDLYKIPVGKIEKKYFADILLIDGNPLHDINDLDKIRLIIKSEVLFELIRSHIDITHMTNPKKV